MRFATGFGIGVLVLPLSFLFANVLGAAPVLLVFGLLTACAMLIPPVGGERAAGVLAGAVSSVVAGYAALIAILSGARIG
jgi:hypothetical protein